jgi:ureidoglycolate hydrolase
MRVWKMCGVAFLILTCAKAQSKRYGGLKAVAKMGNQGINYKSYNGVKMLLKI